MGTNFYLRPAMGAEVPSDENRESHDYARHIGKRSAAGLYCWDCGVTLHIGGESKIHHGRPGEKTAHDTCQWCGKAAAKEGISEGSGWRELGFNKSEPRAKTGVASCASFTWAMPPKVARARAERSECGDGRPIEDEYGKTYTIAEFFDGVLSECPVRFMDFIGEAFS